MAEKKNYTLRLDPDMWKELQLLAAEEFRSVNGEIEYLLKKAVDERLARIALLPKPPVPAPAPEAAPEGTPAPAPEAVASPAPEQQKPAEESKS